MRDINERNDIYGLIGYPIEHSYSPQIFKYLFKKYNISADYLKFQTNNDEFDKFIEGLKDNKIMGFNVTAPYKEKVIKYVNNLNGCAKVTKNINVVKNINGRFLGYNTDFYGIIEAFRYEGVIPKGKKVIIFGSGSVAKTIFLALSILRAKEIVIFNRTPEKADNLLDLTEKKRILARFSELNNKNISDEMKSVDIIINATSVDLITANVGIDYNRVPNNAVFFDVIYNPTETNFLRIAREYGFITANGLSMLIFQAIRSFRIWTGIQTTRDDFEMLLKLRKNIV